MLKKIYNFSIDPFYLVSIYRGQQTETREHVFILNWIRFMKMQVWPAKLFCSVTRYSEVESEEQKNKHNSFEVKFSWSSKLTLDMAREYLTSETYGSEHVNSAYQRKFLKLTFEVLCYRKYKLKPWLRPANIFVLETWPLTNCLPTPDLSGLLLIFCSTFLLQCFFS